MKRVSIHGPPGAGKTWFAERLADRLGLPLHHLDRLYLDDDWQERPVAEADAKLSRLVEGERWIIEGIYPSSYMARMRLADTVFVLHISRFQRLMRLIGRVLANRGRKQPAMPQGKPEELDWGFLRSAWRDAERAALDDAIEATGAETKTVHLRSSGDVAMVLNRLAQDPERIHPSPSDRRL